MTYDLMSLTSKEHSAH